MQSNDKRISARNYALLVKAAYVVGIKHVAKTLKHTVPHFAHDVDVVWSSFITSIMTSLFLIACLMHFGTGPTSGGFRGYVVPEPGLGGGPKEFRLPRQVFFATF